MSDILGPADATNAVTARPAETRTFFSDDTWFKDCSSPTDDDGTDVQAAYLNGILAAMRAIWRVNGNKLDGVTPLIAELGTDDEGVKKGIQHLIQRGQTNYAVDSGAVNALVVSFTPSVIEYKTGMRLLIKAANTNTGAAVLNANTLGNKPIVRSDGTPLFPGDIIGGKIQEYIFDGTSFLMPGATGKLLLSQNVDIYVNDSTGSDTLYDGSAAAVSGSVGPFKTVTKAFAYVGQFLPGTYGVTINIAAGTYASTVGFTSADWAHCPVTINGAGATTILSCSSSSAVAVLFVKGPNKYTLQNFAISSTSTYSGSGGVMWGGGASVYLNGGITVLAMPANSAVFYGGQGYLAVVGNITLTGPFTATTEMFTASGSGSIIGLGTLTATAITISAPVTALRFANAHAGGYISISSLSPPSFVNPGNFTGGKYSASLNGVINTWGAGASYFPGTVAGSTSTGGQYS